MQFETNLQEQTLFQSTSGQGLSPSLLGTLRDGVNVAEQVCSPGIAAKPLYVESFGIPYVGALYVEG